MGQVAAKAETCWGPERGSVLLAWGCVCVCERGFRKLPKWELALVFGIGGDGGCLGRDGLEKTF